MMDRRARRAFVVMPFANEFDQIFEQIIKPALEDSGFEAERADSVLDQRSVIQTSSPG